MLDGLGEGCVLLADRAYDGDTMRPPWQRAEHGSGCTLYGAMDWFERFGSEACPRKGRCASEAPTRSLKSADFTSAANDFSGSLYGNSGKLR